MELKKRTVTKNGSTLQNQIRISLYTIIIIGLFTTSITTRHSQSIFETIFNLINIFYFRNLIPDIVPELLLQEYDFIVVGSGTAGSVIANRLTEDGKWTVLLLEAGGEENIISDIPLAAPLVQSSRLSWGYKAIPSTQYCRGLIDGICDCTKGRVLGGSSVINFMVHTFGNWRDYDRWKSLGNYGWGYKDVLPYFKKSERVRLDHLQKHQFRGINGRVTVENSKFKTKLHPAFLAGGLEMGYQVNDPNSKSQLGFSHIQGTVQNGRRCSSAKAYIRPILDRPNFHVSLKSFVTKILINPVQKVAYGVRFLKNRKSYSVYAKKEVILAAGAIASPHLLMLSGVGPGNNLKDLGIKVIKDLSVGYNLQDHISMSAMVFTINETVSLDPVSLRNPIYGYQYFFKGEGPLTLPAGGEGIAFVKTPSSRLPPDYPDIELVMGAGAMNFDSSGPVHRIVGITDEFFYNTFRNILNQPAFQILPILMNPRSKGRVYLKSTNPFHWPIIEPNYFADPEDVRILIEGIEVAITLTKTRALQKYGATLNETPYHGCDHLPSRSYEYWECCLRTVGLSLQHHVGTCKMGPSSDRFAVVNPRLQVYGISGLRVADASIMPTIPAAHTNAPTYMIGEKAADMIKRHWNRRKVEFTNTK